MSEVLNELAESEDPVDREVAKTLRIYQNIKASRNKTRSVGYEPRDIRQYGAVEVIERRIRNMASGFDEVPAKDSYEAIVLKYPDRFKAEIVALARERIGEEEETLGPTADPVELDDRVQRLLSRTHLPYPKGIEHPRKTEATTTQFLRDPSVKAYVLKRAGGRYEACSAPSAFKTPKGLDYLEVHHIKSLASGGSDRVQNAVGLCANCHRAFHYSADASDRVEQLYKRMGTLIRE